MTSTTNPPSAALGSIAAAAPPSNGGDGGGGGGGAAAAGSAFAHTPATTPTGGTTAGAAGAGGSGALGASQYTLPHHHLGTTAHAGGGGSYSADADIANDADDIGNDDDGEVVYLGRGGGGSAARAARAAGKAPAVARHRSPHPLADSGAQFVDAAAAGRTAYPADDASNEAESLALARRLQSDEDGTRDTMSMIPPESIWLWDLDVARDSLDFQNIIFQMREEYRNLPFAIQFQLEGVLLNPQNEYPVRVQFQPRKDEGKWKLDKERATKGLVRMAKEFQSRVLPRLLKGIWANGIGYEDPK